MVRFSSFFCFVYFAFLRQPEHVVLLTDGIPTGAGFCSKAELVRAALGSDDRVTMILIGEYNAEFDIYECLLDENNQNIQLMRLGGFDELSCFDCQGNLFFCFVLMS